MSISPARLADLQAYMTTVREAGGPSRLPRSLALGTAATTAVKEQAFKAFDADGDGAISQTEFAGIGKNGSAPGADSQALFASLDADQDGKLVLGEIGPSRIFSANNLTALLGVQGQQGLGAWLVSRGDQDGDGGLDIAEYAATVRHNPAADGTTAEEAAQRAFELADGDHDGRLTGAEVGDGMPGLQLLSLNTGASRATGSLVGRNDLDGDGALSFDEAAAAARAAGDATADPTQLFARADADGDGRLTTAELDAVTAAGRDFYDKILTRIDVLPDAGDLLLKRLLQTTVSRLADEMVTRAGGTPGARLDRSA
jgi:Ca2+-binding EF-hand superfamily protein